MSSKSCAAEPKSQPSRIRRYRRWLPERVGAWKKVYGKISVSKGEEEVAVVVHFYLHVHMLTYIQYICLYIERNTSHTIIHVFYS